MFVKCLYSKYCMRRFLQNIKEQIWSCAEPENFLREDRGGVVQGLLCLPRGVWDWWTGEVGGSHHTLPLDPRMSNIKFTISWFVKCFCKPFVTGLYQDNKDCILIWSVNSRFHSLRSMVSFWMFYYPTNDQ